MRFNHFILNDDGTIAFMGQIGGREVACAVEECWANGETIEVADDGNMVVCGACGQMIVPADS